ncbi:XRE family transcriptional regulator [Oecophyllibacter saccharovorans]|uniref:helix-turn-helix transcriptional regulator n=1 Tax=Oecophyllibacter saccharovorans TaxID=2558360 RepID=UPI001141776F|nr:helix-turn-helix transcriptional regulator [Oecophyllibacter saccharovorans]QDH15601.1 XRE family transcriptional regulator [Oecophyllibacter saccharovorans]
MMNCYDNNSQAVWKTKGFRRRVLSPEEEAEGRKAWLFARVKGLIRERMNELGKSLEELGQRMGGRNKASLSRSLKAGADMRLSTMYEFAEALGMEWHLELRARAQKRSSINFEALDIYPAAFWASQFEQDSMPISEDELHQSLAKNMDNLKENRVNQERVDAL